MVWITIYLSSGGSGQVGEWGEGKAGLLFERGESAL